MSFIKKSATTPCPSGRKVLAWIPVSMMLSTLALTLEATAQVSRTVDRAALQNRLTDTVSRFEAVNTAALRTSVQTNTQTPATLDRSIVYRNFQQPDTAVKFKVIKNGAVVRTETARVSDIRLAAGEKVVLPERKEVTAVDQATYNKLKDVRSVPFARADLQMIPELTIESKDGGTRQIEYHLYFFPYQPFTYNDSLRLFQSKMGFFYLRSDSMNVVNAIDPVNIIVTSDALGQIHPRPLKIDHLSFPPADLDLAGKGITDSVAIRIITASKPEGYQTFVKIRPVLDITTDRRTLQGYGIQKNTHRSAPHRVQFIGFDDGECKCGQRNHHTGCSYPQIQYTANSLPYFRRPGPHKHFGKIQQPGVGAIAFNLCVPLVFFDRLSFGRRYRRAGEVLHRRGEKIFDAAHYRGHPRRLYRCHCLLCAGHQPAAL